TVHDGMRGRVMSMMTVILFGFATTGALFVGLLGDRIGVPGALACGGVVILTVAGTIVVRTRAATVLEPSTPREPALSSQSTSTGPLTGLRHLDWRPAYVISSRGSAERIFSTDTLSRCIT